MFLAAYIAVAAVVGALSNYLHPGWTAAAGAATVAAGIAENAVVNNWRVLHLQHPRLGMFILESLFWYGAPSLFLFAVPFVLGRYACAGVASVVQRFSGRT